MTPENYINPAAFPMTTTGHYSVDTQVEMDMFNLHNCRQMLDQGYQMTPEDRKRLAELEAKEPHWEEVLAQLKQRKQGQAPRPQSAGQAQPPRAGNGQR